MLPSRCCGSPIRRCSVHAAGERPWLVANPLTGLGSCPHLDEPRPPEQPGTLPRWPRHEHGRHSRVSTSEGKPLAPHGRLRSRCARLVALGAAAITALAVQLPAQAVAASTVEAASPSATHAPSPTAPGAHPSHRVCAVPKRASQMSCPAGRRRLHPAGRRRLPRIRTGRPGHHRGRHQTVPGLRRPRRRGLLHRRRLRPQVRRQHGVLRQGERHHAPVGWTVVDNVGTGQFGWRFNDPALRGNRTGGTGKFAIIDSFVYGNGAPAPVRRRVLRPSR